MKSRIADLWSQMMLGQEVDPVHFVDELLGILPHATTIRGRLLGDEVEITIDGETIRLPAERSFKFRSVCARLAVVFADAGGTDPPLYGGQVAAGVRVADVMVDAELDLMNRLGDAWFRITRTHAE